jgi:mercuric ion transport protein
VCRSYRAFHPDPRTASRKWLLDELSYALRSEWKRGIVMAGRTWRPGLLMIPGISVALLPKLACPLCWPLYAGIMSSVGLGFLISTKYLLPLTIAFLMLTIGVLAFRAKQRRGYGPLVLAIVGSATVLIGKFDLGSNQTTYTGIVVLVLASAWSVCTRPTVESCSCKDLQNNRLR